MINAVTDELENNYYLDKDGYFKLYKKVNEKTEISWELALACLRLFNSWGICFSNYNGKNKDNFTIIKPDWLFKGIYRIIRSQDGTKNGIITQRAVVKSINNEIYVKDELLKRLIPSSKDYYHESHCRTLLEIMKVYNLAYEIKDDDNSWFIPALCPDSIPENSEDSIINGDYKKEITFEYKYTYLPDSVLQKLMVIMMKKSYTLKHSWKYGTQIWASENREVAIVKMDELNPILNIRIFETNTSGSTEGKHTLFKSISKVIKSINEDMHISCTDYVIYDYNTAVNIGESSGEQRTAYIPLEGLRDAYKNNKTYITYLENGCYEELPVNRIFNETLSESVSTIRRKEYEEMEEQQSKGSPITNNNYYAPVYNVDGEANKINVDNSQDNRKNEGPFAGGSNIGKDGSNIQVGDENKAKSNSKHTQKTDSSTHDTDITIPPQAQKKSGIFSKVADFFIRLFTSQK